ncbi:MAG: V4R domain-containing protein [Myxococcota bacterium]
MSDPTFDPQRNIMTLGNQRLVFHCHHYNTVLQRSIEEMLGEGAVALQIDAAAESTRRLLEGVFEAAKQGQSFEERVARAAYVFSSNGFGRADCSELGPNGGTITLPTSHYAIGWRAKFGPAKAPVCHFAAGFWRGAVVAAASLTPERVQCEEIQCHAVDDGPCVLKVEVR